MWHGFIGQTIASTSKTLGTISKIFMVLALAILLYCSKTIFNLASGPTEFGENRLVGLANSGLSLRDYVVVKGKETDTPGIESIQQSTRNGVVESEKVAAEYMMMVVGMHLLIVKAKPKRIAEVYTERIATPSVDVKKSIFSSAQDSKESEDATFPIMSDASKPYTDDEFWSATSIAVLFTLFATSLFYLYSRRTASPEKHPLAKAIFEHGPIYSLISQIDAEVAAGSAYLLGVRMTENWLISCTVTRCSVMRRDEILGCIRSAQSTQSTLFQPEPVIPLSCATPKVRHLRFLQVLSSKPRDSLLG